jgi:DNA polymerase-3 subunit alpha
MPHARFAHLHVHTEYSILDGLIPVKSLVQRAAEQKLPAMAITDHGNMFGALDFYTQARSAGVKPIIGIETYIAPQSRTDRSLSESEDSSYHLLLLALNDKGYKNLMALSSIGYLEGFYRKPRIDREVLAAHAEGLVALTACTKGELSQAILKGDLDKARQVAGFYRDLFGRNFYIEIQQHGLDEEKTINPALVKLAKELDIPLAATNDVHYLEQKDAKVHEVLLCIQTGTSLEDENRLRLANDSFYMRSPAEMSSLFSELPKAIESTVEIAEKCNLTLDQLSCGKLHLPHFPIPAEFPSQNAYLRHLADQGLNRRYGQPTPGQKERLQKELEIIEKMNFAGYFLVVNDFIEYAKNNEIPVGPGRGSAVGSLVLYSLGITDVDPLKYNLLFERFLNPERVSMPDIDVDFGDNKRDRMIAYVTRKYGTDSVCQIITFGTMQAKAAIRDVARAYKLTYGEADRLAKLVPFAPGRQVTIADAMKTVADLAKLVKSDPRYGEVMEVAQAVEGRIRNASTHAAGVVITPGKLTDYLPLFKSPKTGDVSTQFEMGWLEKCGLLKMDFLGLRNLTVIEQTLALLKPKGIEVDLAALPLDDPLTYELLRRGDTTGVFQLESSGMRDLTVKVKTSSLEDIIAVISLFRPGPMDLIPDFLDRKNGVKKIEYEHPLLEPICRDTYGIMIYQEQVMQAVQALAGYSLGTAYLMLKAISKKKQEDLEKQRPAFIKGCHTVNKIGKEKAEKIFDLLAKFAGYGFNKSHAAGYAVLAFQTAYLKAHYPLEYMSALLSSVMGDTAKTVAFMANCRESKLDLLPPDINRSQWFYVPEGQAIRLGLGVVKNVGQSAVESIILVRNRLGGFTSIEQLLEQADSRIVNRKALESLIKAGCFDGLDPDRTLLLERLDDMMIKAAQVRSDLEKGQELLFGGEVAAPAAKKAANASAPAIIDRKAFLAYEKESLGFYLSGHPLEKHAAELKSLATHTLSQLGELDDNDQVIVGGLVSGFKIYTPKGGKPMAFVNLEDLTGFGEVIVFADMFEAKRELIKEDSLLLVAGSVSTKEEQDAKIVAADLFPLEQAHSSLIEFLEITLEEEQLDGLGEGLKQLLERYPGNCPVVFSVKNGSPVPVKIKPRNLKIKPGHELFSQLADLLGGQHFRLGGSWTPAPPRKRGNYQRREPQGYEE